MSIKSVYETFDSSSLTREGKIILETRVKPLLRESKEYNRISAFFSHTLIKAIFTELTTCLRSGGSIKLVIGIHDSEKLIPVLDAIDNPDRLQKFTLAVEKILEDNIEECLKLMERNQNVPLLFSEMVRQNLIQIKFAAVRNDYQNYIQTGDWPKNDSLFHPKISIFKDDEDSVVLSGSVNETNKGYGGNVEHSLSINSWENKPLVTEYENTFEEIWNGTHNDTETIPFSNQFRDLIERIIANSDEFKKIQNETILSEYNFRDLMSNSPLFFSYSFPEVRLLPHQHAIHHMALSRWPLKALIADEVGLGKTIEAGSIIKYLMQFTELQRFVLLVPASLRYQWQTEMYNLFGMSFYVYESQSKKLVFKPNNELINEIENVDQNNFFDHGIERIIFSWHYVRKADGNGTYKLSEENNIDFLLVDEAHSARLKNNSDKPEDVSSTLLYDFLDHILPHVKHNLLLTATPQQTDFLDYHSLLKLVSGHENLQEDSLKRIAKLNSGLSLTSNEKINSVIELADLKSTVLSIPDQNCDFDDPPSVIRAYSDALYIQNHPTTVFTLRNTRDSLQNIGYRFPNAHLFSQPIEINETQQSIFELVNNYIENILFVFEQTALKKQGAGFVKVIYAQRIVSSLKACYDTLRTRTEKLSSIIESRRLIELPTFTDEELEGQENPFALTEGAVELPESLIAIARREKGYIDEILAHLERNNFQEGIIFDPKINTALNIIHEHLEQGNQIIVFSRFTSTTDFIVDKLREDVDFLFGRFQGNIICTVCGDTIETHNRTTISDAFRRGDFPLIICSDAASEGLNLQAANVLINIDVPWNPARLLQRFGRIDRLGQKKENLYFYNLFYPNTIEDRMYSRLHQRNEDFRTVLGTTPPITTTDHIDELRFQESLTTELPQSAYRNTMINYDNDSVIRIHELILESLQQRDDVTITDYDINIAGNYIKYSKDAIDEDYLDLNHKIFTMFEGRDSDQRYPMFILKNEKGHSFFYCLKREGCLIPIVSLKVIVDYLILDELNLKLPTINYTEGNLDQMLTDTLNSYPSIFINHNKIRFSNEPTQLYQGLRLTRCGSIACNVTFN